MNAKRNTITICLLIGLCFLWTGSGYLTWMYRLLDFYKASSVDVLTEVVGYIFQIIGIIIFSYLVKKDTRLANHQLLFAITIIIDFVLIIFATISHSGLIILSFGYAMNLFHGFVAGFYLSQLVLKVTQQHRGVVFGIGYGIGSLGSWLLSLFSSGNFIKSNYVLIAYTLLVAISILLIYLINLDDIDEASAKDITQLSHRNFLLLAGCCILLLSLVKNIGFYFPMADLTNGNVSLEFTRVFYAIGLIIAGFINDKSRKYGAVSCLAALIFPFILLALPNYINASAILWIIGYFFFGFFVVYRVIFFADLAGKSDSYIYLAALGLMWGRTGDVLGTFTGITLNSHPVIIISLASAFFIITIFVFFQLYHKMYLLAASTEDDSDKHIKAFISEHSLSPREEEVFLLIIEGRSNSEIASDLFISENTVKFHIKNVLKKTNCSNKSEIITLFKKS